VNLAALRDMIGSLLDYDPTNSTYKAQINTLINDAQVRVLTDKPWSFAEVDDDTAVQTDAVHTVGVTNGSGSVTGVTFPSSASPVLPGSVLDGSKMTVTDSAGVTSTYTVAFVASVNALTLTADFTGITGSYSATFKQREVYLPGNTTTVMSVRDTVNGSPNPLASLPKVELEKVRTDINTLGTASSFSPSEGIRIPAPRSVIGVTIAAPGAGRGVRTLQVYMVNVWNPLAPTPNVYPQGVSGGRESALSPVLSITLQDNEELTITAETIPNVVGYYRRYYFTSTAINIDAPVRLRNAADNVDTQAPTPAAAIVPDTKLSTLNSQTFQTRSIRYVESSGVYTSFQLYPHPGSDQTFKVRRLVAPRHLIEDQDTPLIPEAYSQIIAYAAMEQVTLKLDNPALSEVYRVKAEKLYRAMAARYLASPPRRIVRGGGSPVYPVLWGPLSLS
jgi:hypothetical protein